MSHGQDWLRAQSDISRLCLTTVTLSLKACFVFGFRTEQVKTALEGTPTPLNPKSYQIREALEKAGYKEERARSLAEKSDGNLNSLLRCLQNLSLTPDWAQGTDAAGLVIAEILGAWR